jgi:SagB-type dehydrogenase family enzyme
MSSENDERAQLSSSTAAVVRYHDGSKHQFNAFARSLGYLDWASQPKPFRSYHGSPVVSLYPAPDGVASTAYAPQLTTFDDACALKMPAAPLTIASLGDMLRYSFGLSAWKQFRSSRWSLRVNPSSGNLHPTEAYVVCGALNGANDRPAVFHYSADRHVLEQRCVIDEEVWQSACGPGVVLVALTSIHWRESWKYGERAFRYCQHDLGHAIGALSIAAGILGWRALLLPSWPHRAVAAAIGIDRDDDFTDAEREEPGCIMAIDTAGGSAPAAVAPSLADGIRAGVWSGHASQLSEDHIRWSFIDEVARATEDCGRTQRPRVLRADAAVSTSDDRAIDARQLILQRRSAVALDGRSRIDRTAFLRMLAAVLPGERAPWHALWWPPCVHLVLFVHRVDGIQPGLYAFVRDSAALDRLRAECRSDFVWEPAGDRLPLYRLADGDMRARAARVSCDQEIASDGFFSVGMLAEFDASLEAFGPAFYRNLFWETGAIGQVLYLEAEAAGARATGIGCFYDDPVHDLLGLSGHAFQSLYHFTVGMPIEDARLTTEPGYSWEARGRA